MSFLRQLRLNNNHDPRLYRAFRIDGAQVGKVRPGLAEALSDWSSVFVPESDGSLAMAPTLRSFHERSRAIATVLPSLVERGLMRPVTGEPYAVTASTPEHGLLAIDRAAAPAFGVRTFGQHLNGFVRDGDRLLMWIAKRSADRVTYPGRLDNLVAGGLPYGTPLAENLAKECWEEAGIDRSMAEGARPVGAVTYNRDTDWGFRPDTLYCYDLELPASFEPRCTDGEVESFHLCPVEQVAATVRDTDSFKLNVNLVIVDFLIRHGLLSPERDDYLALVGGLRPSAFAGEGLSACARTLQQ